MSVHCPFCQDDIEPNEDSHFCPDCGNPIPELKQQDPTPDSDPKQDPGPSSGQSDDPEDVVKPPEPDSTGGHDPQSEHEGVCPSCGESVESNWDACPFCTADLDPDGSDGPIQECPNCQYDGVNDQMAICPKCQTSLPGTSSTPETPSGAQHPADTGSSDDSPPSEVYLDFTNAGTLQTSPGETLGTEIRTHLDNNGVSTKKAMRVSRQHLMFKNSNGTAHVLDLESANGTKLNGNLLQPNREYEISSGDTLEISGIFEADVSLS